MLNVRLKERSNMESIKKFCNNHGFKEVKINDKERFVRSISSKEWFAVEILENKIRLVYENYSLDKPFCRDNNINMDYIKYLIEIDKLDEFIKKEFIRFVTNVYYYILNH